MPPRLEWKGLEEPLRRAAEVGDAAALARHYATAAMLADRDGSPDAAGFFRTQALVWALVAGEGPATAALEIALRRAGRLD